MGNSRTKFDPILLEVLWNRLVSIVEEQARALMRTSFTSVVREAGDLSAGVFDRRGRMIAQAVTGTPGHINAMATSLHHFLQEIPVETLCPGDVMITNNPQQTAGQLNDFTVITPVFLGDEIIAYFGNCCHALDVGGRGLGADARQVYEEGLFVPVTRLFVRDEPNEELFKLIRANVRTPFEVVGDLYAQAGSNDVGRARLLEMIEEFDLGDVQELSDEVCSRTEAAMREAIGSIPDGVYENELLTDGFDEPVKLAVAVIVEGEEMRVDYAGSSPQSERGINVVLNYATAYTTFGVKCAISPEVPNNDGSFRPITVTAPEGCVLNAQHPAPVGARHIIGHFLPGLIHGALAPAVPDKVLAQGADSLWNTQITGRRKNGVPFTYVYFSGGGMGARPTKDGLSATAYPSGIRGVPAEVIESVSPVVIHRRELRPDSEGAGRYRGGFGQEMEIGVRTDAPWTLSAMYDRTRFPAHGLRGGCSGKLGAIITADGEALHPKRQQRLAAGQRVILRLPGGGGIGGPHERNPDLVMRDVRDGLVSSERARNIYGVVLGDTPVAGEPVVDAVATARLRSASRLSDAVPDEDRRGDGRRGPPRQGNEGETMGEVDDTGLTFFSLEEAETVEALAARIVPGDPGDPGAREAGVLTYLDRALTGPYARWQGAYREGVRLVNAHIWHAYGKKRFYELDEADKDAVISALENGGITDFGAEGSGGASFFTMIWAHTIEGMLSDPAYGGNKDAAGWRLVGFPGAQYGYAAEEMRYGADLSGKGVATLADIRRLAQEKPGLFYQRPGPDPSLRAQEVPEPSTPEREPGEGVGPGQ